jgi:hypothetical protein
MTRHPARHKVIFQTGGDVINCATIANVSIVSTEEAKMIFDFDAPAVVIGFAFSDRVLVLKTEDYEHAHVILSKLKRGMIASRDENFELLDDIDDDNN